MKITSSKTVVSKSLFPLCVGFIVFSVVANGYNPESPAKFNGPEYKYTDTQLKPLMQSPPDTLFNAENQYKKFMDSVTLRRRIKNGNEGRGGNSLSALFIGTQTNVVCDTCGSKWFWKQFDSEMKTGKSPSTPVQRYISLLGWKLKATSLYELYGTDSVLFHVEHNQAYVRKYAIISPPLKRNKDSIYYKYGIVDEPVKFHFDPYNKSILIPVSKSVTSWIYYVTFGIFILLICFFSIGIGIFIRFVIDISKGHAFTRKNINALKFIAITFLVYPFIGFLFNLLLGLIFHSYFTEDVVLNKATWSEAWKSIAIGVVFLMLYKAFRQGKKLKDEQEFTI